MEAVAQNSAEALPARKTYSVPEVAALLGVGRTAVYAAIEAGRIRAIRVTPRRIVVPCSVIDAMLAGQAPAK